MARQPSLELVSSNLQLGNDGRKLVSDTDHIKATDSDGSTLVKLKLADAIASNEAVTKSQLDTKQATITDGDGLAFSGATLAVDLAGAADDTITLSGVDTATNKAGYSIPTYSSNKVRGVFARQSGFSFYIKQNIEAGAKITLSGMTASKFDVEYEIVRFNTGCFTTSDGGTTWASSTSNSNPDFPMVYYNTANDYMLAYDTTNDVWRAYDLSDATGDTDLVQDMVDGSRSSWTSISLTLSGSGQSESLGSGAHEDLTDEIYDIPASSISQVSHTGSGEFPYYIYQTSGGAELLAFNADTGRWVAIQPNSATDYSSSAIVDDTEISVSGSTTYGDATSPSDGSDDYGDGVNIPPSASSNVTYVTGSNGLLKFTSNQLDVNSETTITDTDTALPTSGAVIDYVAGQRGANDGLAPLNSSGRIDNQYLELDVMNYKGNYNASTNTPDLTSAYSGTTGDFYIISATGTQDLDGSIVSQELLEDGKLIWNGSTFDYFEPNDNLTNAEVRTAVENATDSNVFTDADHSKLDGIEALADVTDTANVTAAGALMDSEVTNLAQVKAFDSADYATAAQGATADSAVQPSDLSSNANGEGASTIGVEDSAGNFTATDVEGVLAELYSTATTGLSADSVTEVELDFGNGLNQINAESFALSDNYTQGTGDTLPASGDTAEDAIEKVAGIIDLSGASHANYTPSDDTIQAHFDAIDNELEGWNKVFKLTLTQADDGVNLIKTAPSTSDILEVRVKVNTAFDGTAPTLKVGTVADDDAYVLTSEVDLKTVDTARDVVLIPVAEYFASGTAINATLAIDGSTTGSVDVFVRLRK